jgi:hypothetical protein
MSIPNWQDLLPRHELIVKMSVEQLKTTEQASATYVSVLAHGISGIGNLLACTASNEETGLNSVAVTDIGWMLESLGKLVSNLSDINAATSRELNEVKPRI